MLFCSADFLDAGWGSTAHLRIDPGGWSGFGGIVEAGWIPLEDDRGRPGQEAENTLAHLMAGPMWGVEWGRIHPYVGGVAGVVSSRWATRQAGVEDESVDYGVSPYPARAGRAQAPGRPPSLPRRRRRTFSKRGEGHGLLGRSDRGNLTARCGRTPRVTKERRR